MNRLNGSDLDMTAHHLAQNHPDDDDLNGTADKFVYRRLWVKRLFTYGVGWPLLAYLVFALFVPDNIFDKVPMLKNFAAGVADVVIHIRPNWNILNQSKSTNFPQAALLCSALAMILIPWLMVASTAGMVAGYAYARLENNPFVGMGIPQLLFTAFIVLFGVPAGLWVINMFYAVPGDPSVYAGTTTSSRFGYASLSTGAIVISAGCMWLQPFYITALIDKIFFKGFKNV